MKESPLALVAALAAFAGPSPFAMAPWPRLRSKPEREPIDTEAELAKHHGKRFRHATTGEIRELDNCSATIGRVGFFLDKPTRRGSYYVESTPRKALAWIRNSVEIIQG